MFYVGENLEKKVPIGSGELTVILGPCAIESKDHALKMAENLLAICEHHGLPLIYKSCYDKDCRSSVTSFHGLGVEEGLKILELVKKEFGIPVTADVSNSAWMSATAEVVDLIQIPAYLCRQTHLLVAAGETGLPINIKKGQFMSPWNMGNSVKKINKRTGNRNILLTDRGTFFGYNMLINDFRCLDIMRETGCSVCFDATHSIQLPTNLGNRSGGQREFIPSLVRAACSVGIDALFMEIHDDPDKALCDHATQYPLDKLEDVLIQAKTIHETARRFNHHDRKEDK